MEITVNDLKINYIVRGEGKPLLLLHGWGACIDSFAPVTNELSDEYKRQKVDRALLVSVGFPPGCTTSSPRTP